VASPDSSRVEARAGPPETAQQVALTEERFVVAALAALESDGQI
jgi:hypothetical protein